MTFNELINLNILEVFGLESASESEKKEFLDKAASIVLDRVVARLSKELPEDKREKFFELFKEGASQEDKTAFITKEIPDLEERVFEEMLIFKHESLKIAQDMKHEL